MKTLKNITMVLFALVTFSAVAQNDPTANVKAIAEKASVNCKTPVWGVTAQDSIKGIENYSMYREYVKQNNYKDALVGWRYVFFNNPNAMQTTHVDGITMFESLIAKSEGAEKEAYIDTLLAIYEVRMNCFGKTADMNMRKTFAWFTHRKTNNDVLVYDLFNETVELFTKESSINNISPALLHPWVAMAVTVNKMKKIEDDKVFEIYETIGDIVDHNVSVKNNEGQYYGAGEKVTEFLDKHGYLDCTKLTEMATKKYNADKNNTSNVLNVYKTLRGGKCYDAPIFLEVAEKVVKEQPSPQLFRFLSKRYADMKNYDKAIDYILKGSELEEDRSAKAQDILTAAQFYERKGDFSSARNFANRAADTRPGWGEPFILIGRLYASSGSRCGSEPGWDRQVVFWAAIDMWNKAKNTDASVANDAQKLINQYTQYMPSRSDIFMQSDVSEGGSYTIGCWINVTTTVRASN